MRSSRTTGERQKRTLGAEAGVPTPRIARLVELIHEIERGARPQSLETLDALAAVAPLTERS